MQPRNIIRPILGLALAVLLAAPAQAETLVVFAAASLTNALGEIGEHFAAETGITVKPSFAASSDLAKQIEQGAPAQIFISADAAWMDYLARQKLILPDSRSDLLRNRLVLVAPSDSAAILREIQAGTDILTLSQGGRIASGDPDSVPVGRYFRQSLDYFGQWPGLDGQLVRAASVRAALALVERGEVTLAAVYASDAAISNKVKVVGLIPDQSHEPIVYPVALLADSPTARQFLAYLHSEAARAIFSRYGFL